MDDATQAHCLPDPGEGNLVIAMRYGSRELGAILNPSEMDDDEMLLRMATKIRLLLKSESNLNIVPKDA